MEKMKILHICTYDSGGAGIAAWRISESINAVGGNSKLLVRERKSSHLEVEEYCNTRFMKLLAKIYGAFNTFFSSDDIMYEYIGFDISKNESVKQADVLVLHWTNHFLSYHSISQLIRLNKPIVWVMHDMWLLTGGCHYDNYCGRYKVGCSNCNIANKKTIKHSKENFLSKQQLLGKGNFYCVTPSSWLYREANESDILKNVSKCVIHNPINLDIYYKRDCLVDFAEKNRIPCDRKVILYGAYNAISYEKKGYHFIREALVRHKELLDKYTLVIYGINEQELAHKEDGIIKLGVIKNEDEMAELMNLADVFVAPSEQENYSNSVLEALACGTPVVAFDIGGMPDLIAHMENGYLASYKDVDDLVNGIKYCIDNSEELGEKARLKVNKENRYEIIGNEYISLFNQLIHI